LRLKWNSNIFFEKNEIPVFCPALTDGSIGDMIYFHGYTEKGGLVLDIASDIRAMNNTAVYARKSGMIILGGGVIKHHICNANLMRNGADFSVYINTGHEVIPFSCLLFFCHANIFLSLSLMGVTLGLHQMRLSRGER